MTVLRRILFADDQVHTDADSAVMFLSPSRPIESSQREAMYITPRYVTFHDVGSPSLIPR